MKKMSKSTVNTNASISPFLSTLFWEYDPGVIDVKRHADLIIGRVMERGSWASMLWLRKTYSEEKLISFLAKRGRRVLPPRELNYWAFMSGVSPDERKIWVRDSREKPHVWGARHAH